MSDTAIQNQVRRLMAERDLLLSAIAPEDYAKIEAKIVAISESPEEPPSPEIPTKLTLRQENALRAELGRYITENGALTAALRTAREERDRLQALSELAETVRNVLSEARNKAEKEIAAEREARKQAEVEQFNAGKEAAAKECDQFVEAYSFWTPYPDGYVYSDAESKAAALFAKGRFEVAAKKIRELEPVSGSPERLEDGK
jgi:hypothetical protein